MHTFIFVYAYVSFVNDIQTSQDIDELLQKNIAYIVSIVIIFTETIAVIFEIFRCNFP